MQAIALDRPRLVQRTPHDRTSRLIVAATRANPPSAAPAPSSRRALLTAATVLAAGSAAQRFPAHADDFTVTDSGLRYLDIRLGEGAAPTPGTTVEVDWAGYTKGYQGKRIGNTSNSGEPYEFTLGAGQAIPAFEEAVAGMKVGGIRRIEVPGEMPALGYPRDRSQRFTSGFNYRYGPQPSDLGGQRALDFVLDERTLQDFNRTLLFDIKLVAVRAPRQ